MTEKTANGDGATEDLTALDVAEHLADALDDNTGALNSVQRRFRYTPIFIVAVIITLAVSIKFNHDDHVTRCKAGNELRAEVSTKFQSISDSLRDLGVGETPGEEALLQVLSEDFPSRDCSSIGIFG